MKTVIFTILSFYAVTVFSQQAADYFPAEPGYVWKYDVTPLDSLNNPIDSLSFFGVDSFATQDNYQGKLANIILSKTGDENVINILPYLDSSFINLEGTNASIFFNMSYLFDGLDSLFSDSTIIGLLNSFEGWYSTYRFAQNAGQNYTIFSFDTTITINSVNAPLRFEFIGRRLADENLSTEIGDFICKKFLITAKVSYMLIPIFPVEIFSVKDSVWFAPDNWIVKQVVPTTNIDLSFIGLGSFSLPGFKREIIQDFPVGFENENEMLSSFMLEQNYPNPFNPNTNFEFRISNFGYVTLKVYDVLGNEIAVLVNEEKSPGEYKVEFNASGFASGIYFYKLSVGNMAQTKKMLLIK